jgi:hypothetical protein
MITAQHGTHKVFPPKSSHWRARFIRALILASAFPALALAQNPIDTVDQTRSRDRVAPEQFDVTTDSSAPETYPGEAADTGVQFLIKTKPRKEYVEASVDTQYYYTSNVFLQEDTASTSPTDTGVFVNTISAAYAPTAFDLWGGKLSPRVGLRLQMFNYGLDKTENQLNNLDFMAQTAFAETRLQLWQNWVFGAGFDYTRLVSNENQDSYAEFYKEYVPNLSATRYFPINNQMLASVGADVRYRLTDVDPNPARQNNDRADYGLFASFLYLPIEKLTLQPYYRFVLSDYTYQSNDGRTDYLNTIGFSVGYEITKWAAARVFTSYDYKESDDATVADYTNYNAGLGASLNFRF